MVANYEIHGFNVTAAELPESCTACPFWTVDTKTLESGQCFITGTEIAIDGPQDEKRMNDCPIEKRCCWQQEDWDSGVWFTDCNNAFWLEDGSPEDNKMIFCPFCGKKLRGVPYQQTKNG